KLRGTGADWDGPVSVVQFNRDDIAILYFAWRKTQKQRKNAFETDLSESKSYLFPFVVGTAKPHGGPATRNFPTWRGRCFARRGAGRIAGMAFAAGGLRKLPSRAAYERPFTDLLLADEARLDLCRDLSRCLLRLGAFGGMRPKSGGREQARHQNKCQHRA